MTARYNKHTIQLSDQEFAQIKGIINRKDSSKTIIRRCQIILDRDENHGSVLTYEQCAKSNGVCMATVSNTVAGYSAEGISYLTKLKRNVNSDNARRKIDGRAEAHIIELACSPAPEGHSRWTLRLLEDELKVVLETPVSREAIRRTLKKTHCAPT